MSSFSNTLLAQSALDGDFMLKFLLGGLLLLQIATLVGGLLRGREAKRRSVSFEGVPLDKAEFIEHCNENKREHENLFSKLGGVERGIRSEVKLDVEKIYNEVNRLREGQAAGNALTHAQDRKLEGMEKLMHEIRNMIKR